MRRLGVFAGFGGNAVKVRVSPEVGALLDQAETICLRRGSVYVGVEHLFEALVTDDAHLPAALHAHAGTFHAVVERLYRDAWRGRMPETSGETFYTPRCAATVHEAARLASRMRCTTTTAGHVLLALLADAHAAPSRTLDAMACDRGALLNALRDTLTKFTSTSAVTQSSASAPQPKPSTATSTQVVEEKSTPEAERPVDVSTFTRDLTALAREGHIEPANGRGRELMQLVEILVRKGKHNAILVGEAGTGKTKIVEGLACQMVSGALREVLPQTRILELNVAAMMSGTEYRGKFEAKVFALLEELSRAHDTILFIDEIHLIMGSGATDGSNLDLANLLKPALGRGELRCVGATTLKEYRQCIAKDPAMERRFQTVRVEPLSPEATLGVLESLRASLEEHHCVEITPAAMESAVQLTERYLPNRQLPDKAIDILDQACARERIKWVTRQQHDADEKMRVVTPHTIRKVVSLVSAVPIEEITRDERARLTDLEARLARRVIGQDDAVAKVAAAVKRARTGLADPNRPDAVMLFLGPTGVGKTELAKQLAKQVFGSAQHLLRFDMSEFSEETSVAKLIGAAPGYVGYGEEGRLTGAVKDAPFSVLLFDEIEKAHPRVFDLLLPILDEGRLKDSDGRLVDFRHCMIVFTSNVGADVLSRAGAGVGEREILDALHGHFRPEFINRIDEIVPFYPLLFEDVRAILKGMIDGVRGRLKDQDIRVRMYQRAYEFLAQEGYSPAFGARELRRVVERLVVNPISERLLSGEFGNGDVIEVLIENDELAYRKGERRDAAVESLA